MNNRKLASNFIISDLYESLTVSVFTLSFITDVYCEGTAVYTGVSNFRSFSGEITFFSWMENSVDLYLRRSRKNKQRAKEK